MRDGEYERTLELLAFCAEPASKQICEMVLDKLGRNNMTGPALYKTTAEGNVIKLPSGHIFEVKDYQLQESGRGTVVVLQLKDGSEKRIFRWMVDEAAFQFGLSPADRNDGDRVPTSAEGPARAKRPYHRHKKPERPKRTYHRRMDGQGTKALVRVAEVHQIPSGPVATFTKEELLQLHAAHQGSADLLLRKLVELVRR